MGDRKISIRTSVLEEKATACNMLCCYADELKDGFYTYVEQVKQGTITNCHAERVCYYIICLASRMKFRRHACSLSCASVSNML